MLDFFASYVTVAQGLMETLENGERLVMDSTFLQRGLLRDTRSIALGGVIRSDSLLLIHP